MDHLPDDFAFSRDNWHVSRYCINYIDCNPIVLPVIEVLGFSPFGFGVVMIIACEMAVITPPIGLNLYVIKGVAPDIFLSDISRGALPFVFVEAFAIFLLILFPPIALWLPSVMW
ncbi:TRAP transporter large permease subunit [Halomonas alkalisoli]|uniref:TRAP transporter large permease subunit n=1 Tax=Halomonas alkalisoli TaxID=2907158 RepID=UPI001F1A6539|nr:TRAP transporter large permease subunit [Halomonas alkalisoli]MCE9683748.1 TRAP transporter large permease subunit [Halomonas alkalisoli]